MLQREIESRLAEYKEAYLETDLLSANAIRGIEVLSDQIKINILLPYPCLSFKEQLIAELKAWLFPIVRNKCLNIQVSFQIEAHTSNQGVLGVPQIKNLIAVASGKGGVGKSTVAMNLALALAHEGAAVGILDADIYGPSQPIMLGAVGERPVLNQGKLKPIERHGIQSMSIGYLVDKEAPMVWRGPMLGKAMQQLLQDTAWAPLDYLIVDLPPGTGDIQLTLCQKIPVTGALMVTTPQDLALSDVRRACEMFKKMHIPILGVIENMSIYRCPKCKHEERIFGEGGGVKLAQEYQIPLFTPIPLDKRIREMTDSGLPLIVQAPESEEAKLFYSMARSVSAKLSLQAKHHARQLPKMVVENKKGVGDEHQIR